MSRTRKSARNRSSGCIIVPDDRKIPKKTIDLSPHSKPHILKDISPASRPPFEVPDDVFMGLELVRDGLKDIQGTVEYPPEFNEV